MPSAFSKDFYRERVGVECHVLPNVIDPARLSPLYKYLMSITPLPMSSQMA